MLKKLFLILIILLIPTECEALTLSAKSACLISAESGEIIYEKNSGEKLPMASTTKMMTALVAAKSDKWEEVATVSANAEGQEGSRIYLEKNDKMRLCDLVAGMLLNSGNDAAVAVSEHISGNVEAFTELMNIEAKRIGALNTSFENPSGLDGENHYSTAYDLALIGSEVINNPRLKPIIASKEMQISDSDGNITYLKNHNKLLWSYDGMIGVKTGFTKKSGRCLVTAAERNGITLVAVTLSAPDDWKDHKAMLDYGFDMCEKVTLIEKGEELDKISISDKQIKLTAAEEITAVGIKNKREEREVKLSSIKNPSAPINKGEKLGVAKVYQNGRIIAQTDLIAGEEVRGDKKSGIWDRIKKFFRFLIR